MPPSYFYHLAFELYPHSPRPSAQDQPAATDGEPPFLPPRGTDIFTDSLPVHRVSSWASPPRSRKHVRRSKTAYSVDLTSNRPAVTQRPSYSERRNSHLDSAPASSHALKPQPKPAGSASATKDWRFDRVSIQSIDMEPRPEVKDDAGARGKSVSNSARASSGLATKGKFVPADPKNTEVGWGVVHLYRDVQETQGLYDDTASSTGSDGGAMGSEGEKQAFNEEDCTTLCILAVPSYMTPSDLLGYVGEQTREDVSHFRLIRTGRANKYMVLMKFREAKKARQWRREWNGKLFNSMEAPENECSVCGTSSNLWICLICGNIGCGRYDSAHAFQHYEATSHSYAMDIATQHVWDYAGDGYVHRLIQNKADGKLVDLPAAHSHATSTQQHPNNSMTGMGADTVPREKLDNMGMEYAFLLTSQLDSQRLYFEEQVERAVDKAAKASAAAEEAAASATALAQQVRDLQALHRDAKATVASLEKDVQRLSTRAARSDELARSMTKQFQEEKSVSGALMQRIKHLDARVGEVEERNRALEAEKRDLEEQNRDLSFFISGQEKLKELGEEGAGGGVNEDEVREGRVEVGAAPEERRRRKGKGRK
ncbi:putative ring and ubp finger domain protein [Neofusicoccum parvum UCRNP2]|uniref:Putative ring and ubp finger domain protein n=1 Tax=Botryosphaeria parva (strain UCR-NP2) TaxID=1287680 RepID=R1G048_BOTPV|nr:putative ring and ubp finger domain protein [Neofusicoccum parvum UCRNP2]